MESETLPYTPTLYADICESQADYHMIGWTVCGAEDPAVIQLGPEFGIKHPELSGFTVVRVVDQYVNCAKSNTLLDFSNTPITDAEQALADQVAEEA